MASERVQRRIDRLIDQIEAAADQRDWQRVRELSNDVLLAEAENSDAQNFQLQQNELYPATQLRLRRFQHLKLTATSK